MTVGWKWRKHWECHHQCHCGCNSENRICIINDAGRQAAHKKNNELHGCVILPLASWNITHPCNSRYLGKMFLYIDHNHMDCLYNIVQHSGIVSLYFNICQNIMTYFYSHLYNVCSIVDFIHMWCIWIVFFLSELVHWCEANVAKLLYLDDQQTLFNYKMAYIYMRQTN